MNKNQNGNYIAVDPAKGMAYYSFNISSSGIVSGNVTYGSIGCSIDRVEQYKLTNPIIPGSVMTSGAGRTIPDGDYLIAHAANPNYFLDIYGVAFPAESGTNVSLALLSQETPDPFDVWTVTYDGSGFYSILQRGANIALEVGEASVQCGANVRAWDSNGTNAQKWSISKNANGTYRLQAKCSGFSLDISGGNISGGTNIQQWSNNDTNAQQWVFIPYSRTVSYNANGGTGAPVSQTAASNTVITLSTITPSRSNDIENYTVSLNANGGSVGTNSLTATHTASYSFKNWNTEANGNGTSYNPGAVYTADSSVTLYAQWNSSSVTDSVMLPTPTREHYIFKGWGKSSDANTGLTGSYTPNGNETLYALWEEIKYTITYDANGGTGAPAAQTKIQGQDLTLSSSYPVYSDHAFIGWALSPNGNPVYMIGDTFSIDADTVLYARWKPSYMITYDLNNGEYEPWRYRIDDIVESEWEIYDLKIPAYEGHRFLGWSTDSNAITPQYRAGDTFVLSSSITFYAVWEEVKTSSWMNEKPTNIPDSMLEMRTQYRYSDLEITTDTASTKEGWVNQGTTITSYGEYGPWSNWSTSAVSISDTREVRTTVLYRYYYFYCPVCGRHEPFQGTSDCGQYSLSSGDSVIGWFDTPYNQSSYKTFSYTSSKYYTNSLGDGQDWCFSAGNLNSTTIGTKDTDSDAVVITTGYQYRDRTSQVEYVFERWSDWSEWSNTVYTASDTRRVETRTVYRYIFPSADKVIWLPSALKTVEAEAFVGIAADGVIIPSTVTSIVDGAIDTPFIIGTPGTEAETYAMRNNLAFINFGDYQDS